MAPAKKIRKFLTINELRKRIPIEPASSSSTAFGECGNVGERIHSIVVEGSIIREEPGCALSSGLARREL